MNKFILASLLSINLAGCGGLKINNIDIGSLYTSTANVVKAYTVTEEKEREMGKNMSALLLGTRPLDSNERLNRYVNLVGMWLAANSSRPDLAWRFGVIDTDAINAFAAPGGYIFITKGMLNRLRSEAELAAILAHEIIHVNKQHHLEALKSSSLRGALFTGLSTAADASDPDSKQRRNIRWSKSVSTAARSLYSKGLSKDDEFEADTSGLQLMIKSGYDPYALISTLQMLDSLRADDSWASLMFKTHPKPSDRIANITPVFDTVGELPRSQMLAQRYQHNTGFDRPYPAEIQP